MQNLTRSRGNKSESILGQRLPCNTEAEKSVLGAVLINDSFFTQVNEILMSEDFYSPVHKTIHEAYCSLVHTGKRKIGRAHV